MKFGHIKQKVKKEFLFVQYFFSVVSDLKQVFIAPNRDSQKLVAKIEEIDWNRYLRKEIKIRLKKNNEIYLAKRY